MNRFLLCCITIEKPCHCQELVAVVNETYEVQVMLLFIYTGDPDYYN